MERPRESAVVKTTDFPTGGGDEAGAARGGTPGPVWRDRERAPWSKPRTFRREEGTRRGPPEAVPQAPYGETERERRGQNHGLSDGRNM